MKFTTNRLLIRPVTNSDAEAIFNYRSDAIINKYQGWIPKNLEEVQNFIRKLPLSFNEPGTWFQLALIEKEGNILIGDLGIHFIDDHQVELGCTLNKNYQGKGFANEALKTVIDYLFEKMNKHRITGSIDPNNKSSIKMMEKLGFRKEAHFKESYFIRGEWVDDVVYAMLAKEWKFK